MKRLNFVIKYKYNKQFLIKNKDQSFFYEKLGNKIQI